MRHNDAGDILCNIVHLGESQEKMLSKDSRAFQPIQKVVDSQFIA